MSRLPPAEKLPLAVRKDIRDEFDNKKADLEKKLSDVMGVSWTIDINPLAIHPYAKDGYAKDRLGSCLANYVESAASQLEYFKTYHGDEGIKEVNEICGAHVLTMDLDEAKKNSYCGCTIVDGKLVILFAEGNLGTNINDALEKRKLLQALNDAPAASDNTSKISFAARDGIRQDYDPKIEELRKKIGVLIAKPDIKLVPNFDEAFAKLQEESKRKKNELDKEWESRLGYYIYSYFESVESTMRYKEFEDDDMMQEGFNEVVDKGEIAFRIVDKLEYDSYCEVVVGDGRLYVQTIPSRWGSNASYAAQKLVEQL